MAGGTMGELSAHTKALLDEPNLAFLATLARDGSPQVSPVWVDHDEDLVLVNTSVGTAKDRNMRRDARVALSVADRNDFYRRVDLRGRVTDILEGDEADSHLDRLAAKYLDLEAYPDRREGERRVVFRIRPERVHERL